MVTVEKATVKRISIRNTKTTEEYIKIATNTTGTATLYSYVKICKNPMLDKSKHSYNKDAFIQWLKGANIPKKYITEVEKGGE